MFKRRKTKEEKYIEQMLRLISEICTLKTEHEYLFSRIEFLEKRLEKLEKQKKRQQMYLQEKEKYNMECTVDIENVKEFVLGNDFRDFLMSKTTDFGTAAFVLQTLLEKIDEVKAENQEQEYQNRNADKVGKWELNWDGYYLQCPFCGKEPTATASEKCEFCGARLEK